ncbi:MAG: hypothetical protein P1V97_22445 [Planctomycetota bacterium]|nr:hypothetical protein [Planctomycetota bacterium]
MKRLIGVLALCFLIPAAVEAGILVMKNGNVFQGRIRNSEVSEDFILMRWPYKDFRGPEGGDIGRGYKKFERNRIRWFDTKGDDLTNEYFGKFAKEELDPRFHAQRQLWKDEQAGRKDYKFEEITPLLKIKQGTSIVPVPIVKVHYEIRRPEGWLLKEVPINRKDKSGDTVFTITAPEGEKGYPPRIHVVSVPRPKAPMLEQKIWYEDEIKKLSKDGVIDFREQAREKSMGARKKDITMTTITRQGSRNIMTLRYIKFRRERVYFVTCFAHEEEFPKLRKLFKSCVDSMVIYEDERGE